MDFVDLLFMAGIVALIALLLWMAVSIQSKEEKKRTNKLKELAFQSGYSFTENVDTKTCDFGDFDIFRNRADINIWNILEKDESDFGMKIFDYRQGGGKNAKSYGVFMLEQTKSSLPTFILKKKNI